MLTEAICWNPEQAESCVSRALAAVGIFLAVAAGPAAASASSDSRAQEHAVWASAASERGSDHPGLERRAVDLALAELHRASGTLGAIRQDVSGPSTKYLQAIVELLQPFDGETRLQLADLHRMSAGLGQAWSALVSEAEGTALIVDLAGVDETIALNALSSHPSRPQLKDPHELEPLLRGNDDLVGLVFEALSAAAVEFEHHATLEVEPFIDPEATGAQARAYLIVRTTLSVDDAMARMDRLEERWWLDNSHRASGLLSLAVDHV